MRFNQQLTAGHHLIALQAAVRMKIGVDVGGTNTDAVAMDGNQIVAAVKSPTTTDISSGVCNAISELLDDGIDPNLIDAVMLGTTHFINAFVERKGLMPIGVIRLCLPSCTSIPPTGDWPQELRKQLGEHVYMLAGGNNFDGRPISEFDEDAVVSAARQMNHRGIRSVAITGVFSLATPEMELRAKQIVCDEIDQAVVTLSHRIGAPGLLERENAALINATLRDLSERIVVRFGDALTQLGIHAPFYISQNDGTLMNPSTATQYPVRTFASGATNSMRGAHFLSGERNAIVVDIGGTSTDVGVLVNAYPREASTVVRIGGVRTNFRMPDTTSIALGGGTIAYPSVNADDTDLRVDLGPGSVGHELPTKALVFGGNTLTTTDLAVAAGYADIGESNYVSRLDQALVRNGINKIHTVVAEVVDQMNVGANDLPVVLVGGGAVLVSGAVPGASRTVRPDHADVANAVGAAISQVGVDIERLINYEKQSRDEAIAQASGDVRRMAVDAGGNASTVVIVDIEETQLAYMPESTTRLRVRAVAELCTDDSSRGRAAAPS